MTTTTPRGRDRRPREAPQAQTVAGRVPPHDLDAEAAVLSSCMLDAASIGIVVSFLKPEHFYSKANGTIFDAILKLAEANIVVDLLTIASWLRDHEQIQLIGGASYLAQIADAVPAVANVETYARIVWAKWRRRRVIAECQRIAAEGYGDVGDEQDYVTGAAAVLGDLARTPGQTDLMHVSSLLNAAFDAATKASANGAGIVGHRTRFARLDQKTAGLHDGDLMIIAARPGMGKTALALNVLVNACDPGVDDLGARAEATMAGVLFSQEMPGAQIGMRLACSEGRVDVGKLRRGFLQPDDWRRLTEGASFLASLPIWIDDTPALTLVELRAKLRQLQAKWCRPATATTPARRLGPIVIDYLQLMKGRDGIASREQEISEISRGLKAIAKEFEAPVIALSQLNRSVESRTDKRPQLSDLRESGAIEQDADTIVFIYRDDYYNPETTQLAGIAEVIIAKQRNGPTGKVLLRFTSSCTRFDDLADGDYPGGFEDE